MIREVICSFLDPLDGATEFDAVADFSAHFPVEIISRMLGMPEAERQPIRERLDISLHREHGPARPDAGRHGRPSSRPARTSTSSRCEKRKNPGDDMMSRLTQVTVDRGDGVETGLDDVEIAGFAGLLGGAGAETVTKLVGNAVVLFARHPDQWQKILDDPEKIPRAVEEILRILPPSQYQGRFSLARPRVRGRHAPGRVPGAAHHRRRDARSARVRATPTTSTSNARRASRSGSATACTAASAPRSRGWRAAIAIEELARRWRRFEVDDAGLRRVHMSNVAGYSHVPVRARHDCRSATTG